MTIDYVCRAGDGGTVQRRLSYETAKRPTGF